ncbi:hypothetical protein RFI_10035 [Reticulomyxa filosa]|uniref:N-acetyltransferase domain-containing protein n=1 Tax=Reticulomyxa filosa TaxID=46433 RepID=X6NLD1_RETFI|nr:hypothetical protein RFI_10035 [Reticulomyxa filosa]|eukprot:ETO27100.1 hypothetical protein RFI_10035 [Reticulomyxa filosa]
MQSNFCTLTKGIKEFLLYTEEISWGVSSRNLFHSSILAMTAVEEKTKDKDLSSCVAKLVRDTDSKLFWEWLTNEHDESALKFLNIYHHYGKPISLTKLQSAAKTNFPQRFDIQDESHEMYFRRGVVQSCDRFYGVLEVTKDSKEKTDLYFGHIDCVVVKSPQMEYCNKTDQCVGWILTVYCPAEYRGKGVATKMIEKALGHLRGFVKCVYLLVFTVNVKAFHFYRKCGFEHVKYVGTNDKDRLMRKPKIFLILFFKYATSKLNKQIVEKSHKYVYFLYFFRFGIISCSLFYLISKAKIIFKKHHQNYIHLKITAWKTVISPKKYEQNNMLIYICFGKKNYLIQSISSLLYAYLLDNSISECDSFKLYISKTAKRVIMDKVSTHVILFLFKTQISIIASDLRYITQNVTYYYYDQKFHIIYFRFTMQHNNFCDKNKQ